MALVDQIRMANQFQEVGDENGGMKIPRYLVYQPFCQVSMALSIRYSEEKETKNWNGLEKERSSAESLKSSHQVRCWKEDWLLTTMQSPTTKADLMTTRLSHLYWMISVSTTSTSTTKTSERQASTISDDFACCLINSAYVEQSRERKRKRER